MTDVLVTPATLATELASPAPPLLVDSRPAEEFARGQIAGAVHLDLWGVSLIDTSEAPLKAFMWMIGHLFSTRGVTAERPVVVYEATSGLRAARVFWLLEYLGHPQRPRARRRHGGMATGGARAQHGSGRASVQHVARCAESQSHRDVARRARAVGTSGDGHRGHAQRGRVPGSSGPRASRWRDSRRRAPRVDARISRPMAGTNRRPISPRCTRPSASRPTARW